MGIFELFSPEVAMVLVEARRKLEAWKGRQGSENGSVKAVKSEALQPARFGAEFRSKEI